MRGEKGTPGRGGVVIAQSPSPGSEVPTGSVVELIVRADPGSSQPQPFQMPDFRRMPVERATALAESRSLRSRTGARPGSPPGVVLDQDPKPGSRARPGDLVTLFVAQGIVVPDVVRRSVKDAVDLIRRETGGRLKVESVRDERGSNVSSGTVVNQLPPAGTTVGQGSGMRLIVASRSGHSSIGVAPSRLDPQDVIVPNVIGMDASRAAQHVNSQTRGALKVSRIEGDRGRTQSSGRVIRQQPSAGSRVKPGTPVTLIVQNNIR
jgi:serine/threonine-protein kinase